MSRERQYGKRRKAGDAGDVAEAVVPRGSRAFPYIIGAIAFLIYLRTMTPGMQMGDGTELAAAAHVMGVPHPTGYPFYMLLTKLWLVLTFAGDAIVRTTMLNALLMSAAVGITAVIFADLLRSFWKTPTTDKALMIWAGAGALTLAFLRFHWANAVVTEVYALQFLLMVVFTRFIQKIDSAGGVINRSHLLGATVCFALACAHHRLAITLLLPWGVLWFIAWRQRKRNTDTAAGNTPQGARLPWVASLFILVAGASLYAYLPIRASVDPPVNWGNPDSASRFYHHVRGTEFLDRGLLKPAMGQSFSAATLGLYARLQTSHLLGDLAGQFAPFSERIEAMPGGQKIIVKYHGTVMLLGVVLAGLAVWGLWVVWSSGSRWTAAVLAAVAFQNLAILYVYNIADIRDYFLYPFWAAWVGLFALGASMARKLQPERRLIAGYALLLLPVAVLAGNWQRGDHSAEVTAELLSATILPDDTTMMPHGSILITDDDSDTFTTWYRQMVRGDRSDVLNFAANFIYMPWYKTFFTEAQRRDYNLKFADRVAFNAAGFTKQIRDGIIDANVATRPIFASISDPAVLTELAKVYTVEPVDAVETVHALVNQPVTTILYRISMKDQAQ